MKNNLRTKSERKIKEKTNKVELLKQKIKDVDTAINDLQHEMKRKPMFHKLDAIYALKKIPSTIKDAPTYYGLVKRGNKLVEVEILKMIRFAF